MEAKTPLDPTRDKTDDRRPAEPHKNGKHAVADDGIARLETAILKLGEQQGEIVRALGALSARMPVDKVIDPVVELAKAVQLRPTDPKAYQALGQRLMVLKEYEKALAAFRGAAVYSPDIPVVHTGIGMALEKLDRPEEALEAYMAALVLEPMCPARKHYTDLLFSLKRFDDAIAFWKKEMLAAPHDVVTARNATATLLRANRLEEGAVHARITAERGWSTRLWPKVLDEDPILSRATPKAVKAPKLRHDIEQLEYLVTRGIKTKELPPIIEGLRKVLARVAPLGDLAHSTLTQDERIEVGQFYNRIVHMVDAPEVPKALTYAWDMAKVEEEYISRPPGIIYIDNLLSPEAMASLRRFCTESTIWLSTNHDNGYLGAYLTDGFCPPLMIQIARELRAAMPRVIGNHRLSGMWAYKYDQTMTGINTHADMAAVNVNFWITPDDANLDPESGGLIVYDAEAPLEWDFPLFNGNSPGAPERIQEFLRTSNARRVEVPYKQNRAVIFNSDLFHQTATLHFKPGYENRRVNVTLLYGDRADGRLDAGASISE